MDAHSFTLSYRAMELIFLPLENGLLLWLLSLQNVVKVILCHFWAWPLGDWQFPIPLRILPLRTWLACYEKEAHASRRGHMEVLWSMGPAKFSVTTSLNFQPCDEPFWSFHPSRTLYLQPISYRSWELLSQLTKLWELIKWLLFKVSKFGGKFLETISNWNS